MSYGKLEIWTIILALGAGTFLLRFSFLGLMGNRPFPDWLQRHLRYTAAAVLPGLAMPIVLQHMPDGGLDPLRLMAAGATIVVGVVTRSTLAAILGGGVALVLPYFF